jgi:hypothetical protein
MKNHLKYSILALAVLAGCSKDASIKPKNYPFVLTKDVVVTEEGAIFHAEMIDLGDNDIRRYGFIWILPKDDDFLGFSRELDLHGFPPVGDYSYKITAGLIAGQEYLVRAFAETNTFTVFGNTISFTSEGCIKPQITSFSPTYGRSGTSVEITGINFSPYKEDNYVCIGVKTLILDEAFTERILITIPNVTQPLIGPITLVTAGMTVITEQKFEIIFP